MAHEAFLTIEQVLQTTGMKRSTYYDRHARGVFPEPVRVGQREVVYPAEVITAWMTANPQALTKADSRPWKTSPWEGLTRPRK
jgi:predicted DNA-binding transcriptional regulator AlpA